ncbi:MAG: radical SAM protein [Eubacteriales bacterium]|nr:radical SAM protein [Eubacteriales bacterium]
MSARERIIPVFVPHLGCPNDCVFCNQRRISGNQTPAIAEDVERAVEEGVLKTGSGDNIQLAFYGGSFTAIPVEEQLSLLGAAKKYLDRGMISSVRLSTRPDAIDHEVLSRLRNFGVGTIEIGAQSLCDDVLLLSGRGHTAADVENASRMIKDAGFRLILQMMTGLPGDTPEKSVETAKKIISLKPDGVRIYPTVIVQDTALYDLWKAGLYSEHTVEAAVELCAVLLPMFEEAGIPVIRLGLNPTDELSSGAAAAGAYHPALGELVKSRIMRGSAEKLLENFAFPEGDRRAEIAVPEKLISQMAGQHRCNIEYLKEKYSLSELKIVRADPAAGQGISIIFH